MFQYAVFRRTETIPKAAEKHNSELLNLKKKKKKKKKKKNTQSKKHVTYSAKYEALFSRKNKTLTIKMPRKPASENVVCICRLLNILANFSNLFLHTGKQYGPRSDFS